MSLENLYGRKVPQRVRLSDDFDAADDILSRPGDAVEVVAPPPNVELDECSLFVHLKAKGSGDTPAGRVERLYVHEYQIEG